MARKYILEPTEFTFEQDGDEYGTYLVCNDASAISPIFSKIDVGMIFDFNNGDKFIVAAKRENNDSVFHATRDGKVSSSPDAEQASFRMFKTESGLTVATNNTDESGTYTVSIYTETEDYPVKNFTYEFANPAKNDIEDLIQAIYYSMKRNEPTNINGYSPMDRLVIAIAAKEKVNPAIDALILGNYPNQLKRIAAIFRGEFSSGSEAGPV